MWRAERRCTATQARFSGYASERTILGLSVANFSIVAVAAGIGLALIGLIWAVCRCCCRKGRTRDRAWDAANTPAATPRAHAQGGRQPASPTSPHKQLLPQQQQQGYSHPGQGVPGYGPGGPHGSQPGRMQQPHYGVPQGYGYGQQQYGYR